jgi:hypothetical protein
MATTTTTCLSIRHWSCHSATPLSTTDSQSCLRSQNMWLSAMPPSGHKGHRDASKEADMLVSNGRIAAIGHSLAAPRGTAEVDATGMHVTPGTDRPTPAYQHPGQRERNRRRHHLRDPHPRRNKRQQRMDIPPAGRRANHRQAVSWLCQPHRRTRCRNQDAVGKRCGRTGDAASPSGAESSPWEKTSNAARTISHHPHGHRTDHQRRLRSSAAIRKRLAGLGAPQARHPTTRDLQLEPILEVIRGKRFAHVHAYRQDEMLMMMRLAERLWLQDSLLSNIPSKAIRSPTSCVTTAPAP